MQVTFEKAQDAFEYLFDEIKHGGVRFGNTKALFNVGANILRPLDNIIHTPQRKWKIEYADSEWLWYLSGDPSIKALGNIYGKVPKIWQCMADDADEVRSNYGWQWYRNEQLDKVIGMLKKDPTTRKAAISIYDGKEIDTYGKDTPCTYSVQFSIIHGGLHMSVYMRSNDLWFGFCNDQYCFSMLQQYVADKLNVRVGSYYHHVHNMHIYDQQLNKM